MKRPWLQFLVPRDWSGEQALTAASLLREARDALGSWPRELWAEVLPEIEDDEIPF